MSQPAKPYPWYYAVNDRPVMLVETPSGGGDCLVLDMRTGRLVPDRSYYAAVAPGSDKDVDQLDKDSFEALVMVHRVQMLRGFCERLCHAASGAKPDLLAALGVPVDPMPLGADQVYVTGGEVSLANVELWFPPGTLSREALDHALGASRHVPGIGGGMEILAYEVMVPGAKFKCSVFAGFAAPPRPEDSVRKVTMRLDRAVVVAPMPRPVG